MYKVFFLIKIKYKPLDMLLILTIMMLGSILGYSLAKKRNGKLLDKLQYIAVFGIVFLLISIIIQIIIMRSGIF